MMLDQSILASEVGLLGVNALGLLVPAVGTLLFMIRFVDRIPLRTFGTGLHEQWKRNLMFGLLIATGMLVLFDSVGFLIGGISIEAPVHPDGFWLNLALIVTMLGISAANEELVFRGYPLQVLMVGLVPGLRYFSCRRCSDYFTT